MKALLHLRVSISGCIIVGDVGGENEFKERREEMEERKLLPLDREEVVVRRGGGDGEMESSSSGENCAGVLLVVFSFVLRSFVGVCTPPLEQSIQSAVDSFCRT